MVQVRLAEELGGTNWDWLDSRHTLAFGDSCDPVAEVTGLWFVIGLHAEASSDSAKAGNL